MQGVWKRACVLAVFLLVIPTVVASTLSEGMFTTVGPLTFPTGAEMKMTPLAVLDPDTKELTGFMLTAPHLHVHVFESRYFSTGLIGDALGTSDASVQNPIEWHDETFVFRNATLHLTTGPSEGFLGFYPRPSGTLEWRATSVSVLDPRDSSTVADPTHEEATREDPPELPYYHQTIERPHVHLLTPGSGTYTGPGAMKVHGPNVLVQWSGESTRFETGVERLNAAEVVHRWLYLEFEDAIVDIQTDSAVQMATPNVAEIAWSGTTVFTPRAGVLSTDSRHYIASGAPATVTGHFTGEFTPHSRVDGMHGALGMEGFLQSTSIRGQPATRAQEPSFGPEWGWVGIGLIALAATTGAYVIRNRFRGPRTRTPSDNVFPRAAHTVALTRGPETRLARERRPHNSDGESSKWRGAELSGERAGDRNDELNECHNATDMTPPDSGRAHLRIAILLLASGGPLDQAEAYVAEALSREPRLVDEVLAREPDVFNRLKGSPRFEAAIADALTHLGPKEGIAGNVGVREASSREREAQAAADSGDYARAAELLAAEHRRNPHRHDLILAQARYHYLAEDFESAMAKADDASALLPTGEAELLAAQSAASLGWWDEVEYYAVKSLQRAVSVEFVNRLVKTPGVKDILNRPSVQSAIDRAVQRITET